MEGLKRMGLADAEIASDEIFRLIDVDADGSIQFSEFCTATIDRDIILQPLKIKAAFQALDSDLNGFVTFNELQ